MVKLADILDRLPDAKQSGKGWVSRCPAHEDHDPSLSLREENGQLLLHCFAGCSFSDVLEALGFSPGQGPKPPVSLRPAPPRRPQLPPEAELKRRRRLWLRWQNLFPGSEAERYLQGRRIPPDVAQAAGVGYCPPGEWPNDPRPWVVFPLVRLIDGRPRLINLAGRSIKDDGKRYMTGPRGYLWSPAEAVTARGDVVAVEGMVDALASAAAGNPRTVAVGGTNLDAGQLIGAERVILLPDFDGPGREALAKWTDAVREAGISPYWVERFGPFKDAGERWAAGESLAVNHAPDL